MTQPPMVAASGAVALLRDVPAIIYGTAWKAQRTSDCVFTAIQRGFRAIDTACQPKHYYEPGVGDGIGRAIAAGIISGASSLWIQTKYTPIGGQDPTRVPYDPRDPIPVQVATSMNVSLRNLNVPRIDCWILHSPLPSHEQTMIAWRAMEAFVASGHTRSLGISNMYDPVLFEQLLRDAAVKPLVLQNRFYAETGYDTELRRLCQQHSVRYESFWTLSANPHLTGSPQMEAAVRRRQAIPSVGLRATRESVMLAYVAALGITPLTGTTNPEHMADDLAAVLGTEPDLAFTPTELEQFAHILMPPRRGGARPGQRR